VGLLLLGCLLAIPPLVLLSRVHVRHWNDPRVAASAAMAVVLLLWAVDGLLNAFVSPIYLIMAGSVTNTCIAAGSRSARRRRPIVHARGPGVVGGRGPRRLPQGISTRVGRHDVREADS
jgi:hypothetical protein